MPCVVFFSSEDFERQVSMAEKVGRRETNQSKTHFQNPKKVLAVLNRLWRELLKKKI